MLFSYSLLALEALTFLTLATPSVAGHARLHHFQARHAKTANPKRDQRANGGRRSVMHGRDTSPVAVTLGDLQLLQQESTAFTGWMNSWFASSQSIDRATSAAQLKQELQAYEGWINAWLDSAMNSTVSAPSLPSQVSVTTPAGGASVSLAVPTTIISPIKAKTSATPPTKSSSAAAAQSPANTPSTPDSTSPTGGEFFQAPATSAAASSPSAAAPQPSAPQPVASSPAASPSSAPASQQSSSPPPSSGSYQFNAAASNNVAVYYGQSGATGQVSLSKLCQDSSVDIVVLAFLTTFFGPGGMPSINLGSSCGGQTAKMQAAGATGLMTCPTLSSEIQTCQSAGKKVLLSLGGSIATSAFSSDAQATAFASTLWNLFGGGTGLDAGLRPFGADVSLDGFDVDNEDHSTAHYETFVSALRTQLNSNPSTGKKYYISAAPQCPRPDASIPLAAMQSMDFVFVQFYNNGDCNVGQPGFADSFKAWSQDLAANGAGPKLYIGAPGCSSCAGSGYVAPAQLDGVLQSAMQAGVSNFGGVMLWDGPEALENTDGGGKDYLSTVKAALGS
ncbi:MAG: hypothetical protein Q9191_005672 [Dirinaria sp. TL-2023a]